MLNFSFLPDMIADVVKFWDPHFVHTSVLHVRGNHTIQYVVVQCIFIFLIHTSDNRTCTESADWRYALFVIDVQFITECYEKYRCSMDGAAYSPPDVHPRRERCSQYYALDFRSILIDKRNERTCGKKITLTCSKYTFAKQAGRQTPSKRPLAWFQTNFEVWWIMLLFAWF